MQLIKYSDLKHDEHYIFYYSESTKKRITIFKLEDKKPVMTSFTIISVKHRWSTDDKNKVEYSCDYPATLFPNTTLIYSLTEKEFETQVLIPSF